MNLKEILEIIRYFRHQFYLRNKIVFYEGETNNEQYLILNGKCWYFESNLKFQNNAILKNSDLEKFKHYRKKIN